MMIELFYSNKFVPVQLYLKLGQIKKNMFRWDQIKYLFDQLVEPKSNSDYLKHLYD